MTISRPRDGDYIEVDAVSLINTSLLIYEGTAALQEGTYTLIETTDAIESVIQFTQAPELFLVIEFKND